MSARRPTHRPTAGSVPPAHRAWAKFLPVGGAVAIGACIVAPSIRADANLLVTFAGVTLLLLAWAVLLIVSNRAAGRRQVLEFAVLPQDYLQALTLAAILAYWGFHWEPLRQAALLIAAQVVFGYAFDMLLSWSRRERYTLGLTPVSTVVTLNLFLRFHDNWFVLQFAMVAVAFLGRELVRWTRDGQSAPVLNPAAFSLALVSLGLVLAGTPQITWGGELASALFVPPQIYLFVFVVALPGQYLFRLTTMTLPAVLTTYAASLLYFRLTGTYFFVDSSIPIAAFLGMHVLFTDPSTSPRTELGRIVYGVSYGVSVVGLHWLLRRSGVPTFYATLLPVALMNVMVKGIDRIAQAKMMRWLSPESLGARLTPGMRSLVYTSLWVVAFGAMSAVSAVGDRHEGRTVPFRYQACKDNRANGCRIYASSLTEHCTAQAGWACNELGVLMASGRAPATTNVRDLFTKACGFGSRAACGNADAFAAGRKEFAHGEPTLLDFRQILRQGKPMAEKTPFQIYTRACDEGWMAGCGGLSGMYFTGTGVAADKHRAAALGLRACEGGNALACSNLGLMHNNGDGVPKDRAKALAYLQAACDLGLETACKWMDEESAKGS